MKISLKRLTEGELELIMHWRMREDISRYLISSPELNIEGQYKWFEKIKYDKTQIWWIIWTDDTPVGSMYLTHIDYTHMRCYGPGWFLENKKLLNLKQLVSLQRNCYKFAFDVLGLNRLYGDVMAENEGVVQLVKLCGFEIEGTQKQHVLKNGVFHDMVLLGLTKQQWEAKKENMRHEDIEIER